MHHGSRFLRTRLKPEKSFCIRGLQSLQLCVRDFNGDYLCIITLEQTKLSLWLTEHSFKSHAKPLHMCVGRISDLLSRKCITDGQTISCSLPLSYLSPKG